MISFEKWASFHIEITSASCNSVESKVDKYAYHAFLKSHPAE
jgi:hypothetical protein